MRKSAIIVLLLCYTWLTEALSNELIVETGIPEITVSSAIIFAPHNTQYDYNYLLANLPPQTTTPLSINADSEYWVRIEMQNNSIEYIQSAIEFFPFDKIEFYAAQTSNKEIIRRKSGAILSFAEKNTKNFSNIIEYTINPLDSITIVAKLFHDVSTKSLKNKVESYYGFPNLKTKASIYLHPYNAIARKEQRIWYQLMLFLGVCLSMLFFNFILYLFVKDKVYLYYVISILGIILYYLFYHNAISTANSTLTDMQSYQLKCLSSGIIIWGLANFARFFLMAQIHFKKWNVFYKIVSWIGLFVIVLCSLDLTIGGFTKIYTITINLTTIIANLLVPVFALYAYNQKIRYALSFFYANVIYACFNVIFVLFLMDVLPANGFTKNSMGIGFVFQAIALSMTLAERIKILREEKTELKEKQLIEIKKITEDKNIELQKLVDIRTSELNTQNISLNSTVSELNKQIAINEETNQKLSESNETKDKLFGIIAHDLRSPFTGLIGLLDKIICNIQNLDKNKIERWLLMLKQSSEEAYSLLNNLLYWSRSSTGQLKCNPQEIEITSSILKVIKIYETVANNKSVKLNIQGEANNLKINADPDMFNIIVHNLITNAIKFSHPDSSIDIMVNESKDSVRISIRDYGIGISEENIKKIMSNKIPDVNNGTKNESGSGLGLMLCKEFMDCHRGKLEIVGEENKGSCFTIIFPTTSHNSKKNM